LGGANGVPYAINNGVEVIGTPELPGTVLSFF